MSSNDKTADLLVATTRATKADSGAESPAAEQSKAAAEKKVSKKKAAPKKATKKAVAKKAVAKKAVAKKAPIKAKPKPKAAPKRKEVEAIVSFGRRVWPD